jgi:O-methyltransferase
MTTFLISVIRPEGYIHSDCLREIAETLQYGLRRAGHSSCVLENVVDPQATNIILGAHLLTQQEGEALPAGTIIYNLEPLRAAVLPERYYALARQHRIWDYSPLNLERWEQEGCAFPPLVVGIGYVPELRRIASQAEPDIDVLFYGSINKRRLAVLEKVKEAGVRLHTAFGVYGKARDALIARAKIILNIHQTGCDLFESVRVSYLLANAKAVVSESSPDIGYFKDAVVSLPYEELAEGCLALLRDDARRKELERRGFGIFSQHDAARIYNETLARMGMDAAPAESAEKTLRRLYLDMVQRCVINLIYEDANQDRWSPPRFHRGRREFGRDWPSQAHSMIGNVRMSNLRHIVETVIEEKIPGDLMETGVWRGGACIMMRAVLKAYEVEDRCVWVADSFCGLPQPKPEVVADTGDLHHTFPELAVPLEEVKANFAKYGLLDGQVKFLKGWFSETLPSAPIGQLAVLRLDGDMYESTMDALVHLYDRVSPGGFVIVDDFGAVPGCRKAVLEFRAQHGIADTVQQIDGYGIFWRKTSNAAVAAEATDETCKPAAL